MNAIKKFMQDNGIESRPRSEWNDEMKITYDRLVYGTGFGRRRPDGTIEHIPFGDVVIEYNR